MQTSRMHQPKTDLESVIEQEARDPYQLNGNVFSLPICSVVQYEDRKDDE
jgi:hypothetical protein